MTSLQSDNSCDLSFGQAAVKIMRGNCRLSDRQILIVKTELRQNLNSDVNPPKIFKQLIHIFVDKVIRYYILNTMNYPRSLIFMDIN